MAITQLSSSVNKLVLEAFDSGWRTYEIVGTRFFNKKTPERYEEKFSVTASDGDISSVSPGASFPSVDISEVGTKTITQAAYKKEIPVDFLTKEFDNYGVILREATKHGYRAKQVMDQVMANILLNTEGTSTVWDGLSLANSAHLIGNTGSTQSNITTGAMSEAVVNSADVALGIQKDAGGKVMPTVGRYLVHPKTLAMTVFKLLKSTEGPETANRETGYLNTLGIVPVTWALLDASNTTDSHLIADKMFNRLEYLVKVEPRINVVRDTDTGNTLYQVEFACAAGAVDYLGYQFLNAA
jgi:hypothetical protein